MSYGTNAPQGLVPVRYLNGAPWNDATNEYPIASGYSSNIGKGDPVAALSDGTIGIGVAGATCRGVFMGCKFYQPDGTFRFQNNWIASTTIASNTTVMALIADDPNLVFNVQETDGSGNAGTPLALADVNLNINFRIGTPTSIGISTSSINNATENTTSTLNLKLLGLMPYPGNVVGSFANWLVTWNVHDFKSVGTAGV